MTQESARIMPDEFPAWRHRRELFAMAYRVLRSVEAAEDATQETLLKAWLKRDRFDGKNLLAWLRTILYNTCKDALRKRGGSVLTVEKHEALGWMGTQACEGGQAEVGNAELRGILTAWLHRAVAELPAYQRDTIEAMRVALDMPNVVWSQHPSRSAIPIHTAAGAIRGVKPTTSRVEAKRAFALLRRLCPPKISEAYQVYVSAG